METPLCRGNESFRRPTRRELTRAATVEEIKAIALDLLRAEGIAGVRFADIARSMSMSPPALYRYFGDRDALLTALITDSYEALGKALQDARDGVAADDVAGGAIAVCTAYRRWATSDPERFGLIFGTPVPGYVAPEDGPTTPAAERALSIFIDLVMSAGADARPSSGEVEPALEAAFAGDAKHPGVPPATMEALMHGWCMLHGFTCLEAFGLIGWLDDPARDALFQGVVEHVRAITGMPG